MAEKQKNVADAEPEMSDVVKLRRDVLFWDIGDGGSEIMRKAGTEYPIVDVFMRDGIEKILMLEYYDQCLNSAWFATLPLDDVEVVWKCRGKA